MSVVRYPAREAYEVATTVDLTVVVTDTVFVLIPRNFVHSEEAIGAALDRELTTLLIAAQFTAACASRTANVRATQMT